MKTFDKNGKEISMHETTFYSSNPSHLELEFKSRGIRRWTIHHKNELRS